MHRLTKSTNKETDSFFSVCRSVQVKRNEDGVTESLAGNQNGAKPGTNTALRWFYFTLFAPAKYTLDIVPPAKAGRIIIKGVTFTYTDDGACGKAVDVSVRNHDSRWVSK